MLEVAIRLIVIGRFSVDTANGVNSVITIVVIGVLVLATVAVGRRVGTQAVSADGVAQPRLGLMSERANFRPRCALRWAK